MLVACAMCSIHSFRMSESLPPAVMQISYLTVSDLIVALQTWNTSRGRGLTRFFVLVYGKMTEDVDNYSMKINETR